jgi:hypothetical protein
MKIEKVNSHVRQLSIDALVLEELKGLKQHIASLKRKNKEKPYYDQMLSSLSDVIALQKMAVEKTAIEARK